MPSGPRAGLAVAPLFVVLWSTGFIGAKLGLPHAEPLTFLATRYALVAGLLGAWFLVSTGARALTWRQTADAALIGALIHGVYLGCVFSAIALGVEAGTSALIVGLQPIATALIARRVLGERLSALQWAGMAVGVAGVALVVARKVGDGVGDWRGVGLCAVALVAIAAASVLQKTRAADHPMRAATLVQFVAAFAVTAPLALVLETNRIDWTGEFVFALGWLVLVLSVGAVMLLYVLIRRGGASNVASLFFLVPASTALIAWPVFGETLTAVELGGVAATALGVLMVNRPGLFRRRAR